MHPVGGAVCVLGGQVCQASEWEQSLVHSLSLTLAPLRATGCGHSEAHCESITGAHSLLGDFPL